jgi:hypothetical protein
MACMYTTSFLPYGRFYNRLGGNIGMLLAYIFVFLYLGFIVFRRIFILETFLNMFYNKTKLLSTSKI